LRLGGFAHGLDLFFCSASIKLEFKGLAISDISRQSACMTVTVTNRLMNIVNIADVPEEVQADGDYWESRDKPLTPALTPRMGHLGVTLTRLPPGKTGCPFHSHQIEDEVFFVLEGRGVFRYGETVTVVKPGDCMSCPAGTGTAHQLANPFETDFVYLAIGMNDPNEVATYPDSGKIMVRALKAVGMLATAPYLEGEPDVPKIFGLARGMGNG
jgi:uncharacterized cupin superfamily protein